MYNIFIMNKAYRRNKNKKIKTFVKNKDLI